MDQAVSRTCINLDNLLFRPWAALTLWPGRQQPLVASRGAQPYGSPKQFVHSLAELSGAAAAAPLPPPILACRQPPAEEWLTYTSPHVAPTGLWCCAGPLMHCLLQ